MSTDETNRRVIEMLLDPLNVTATNEEVFRMAGCGGPPAPLTMVNRNPRPNPKECPKCSRSKTPPI